ncbi:MAG TPA: TetR/AcrR family transcriptional regulator [Actinocrinis sp.]|nr:TetR/AcrR family transcriptional regulator [Actinocrinis sp.]
MTDGRLTRGEQTRRNVLDTAVALASTDGLDGMSLSRLADALAVSKSGLFAHWPDKESLQLAVVAHAAQQWENLIVVPALHQPRGVRRLWALHENRLAFYTDETLPGGCFFAASDPEFDDRPGPVRDALAAAITGWLDLLKTVAEQAVELGELAAGTDLDQLAFEIQALGDAVVTSCRLLRERQAIRYSRRAVLNRLRALSPTPDLLPKD